MGVACSRVGWPELRVVGEQRLEEVGVEGVREAMVRLAPTAHAVQASQCVCITLHYRKMLVESYRMHI